MKVFWIKASGKTTAIPWFTWRFRDDMSNIFIKWSNPIEKLSNYLFCQTKTDVSLYECFEPYKEQRRCNNYKYLMLSSVANHNVG